MENTNNIPERMREYLTRPASISPMNLSHVRQSGEDALLLKNGETLPFSRSRKQDIQKVYAEWTFTRARKGGWARSQPPSGAPQPRRRP